MITQPHSQRRTYHRVRFPPAEQPRWIVGETSFAVVDLSEASCRLDRCGEIVIDLGQPLSGVLQFSDGEQVWIEGHVVRLEPQGIIVQFTKGVNLKKMMALQRWLLQKYPARRDGDPVDPSQDRR